MFPLRVFLLVLCVFGVRRCPAFVTSRLRNPRMMERGVDMPNTRVCPAEPLQFSRALSVLMLDGGFRCPKGDHRHSACCAAKPCLLTWQCALKPYVIFVSDERRPKSARPLHKKCAKTASTRFSPWKLAGKRGNTSHRQ